MKNLIKKLFPKTYWSIWEESRQDLFRYEYEMQEQERKYNNLSHGLPEYKGMKVLITFITNEFIEKIPLTFNHPDITTLRKKKLPWDE